MTGVIAFVLLPLVLSFAITDIHRSTQETDTNADSVSSLERLESTAATFLAHIAAAANSSSSQSCLENAQSALVIASSLRFADASRTTAFHSQTSPPSNINTRHVPSSTFPNQRMSTAATSPLSPSQLPAQPLAAFQHSIAARFPKQQDITIQQRRHQPQRQQPPKQQKQPRRLLGSAAADSALAAMQCVFQACGGSGWTRRDNWISNASVCEWWGVGCSSGGDIIRLDLATNNLRGSLPACLSNLSSLQSVYAFRRDCAP